MSIGEGRKQTTASDVLNGCATSLDGCRLEPFQNGFNLKRYMDARTLWSDEERVGRKPAKVWPAS